MTITPPAEPLTAVVRRAMAGDDVAREEIVLRTRAKLARFAAFLVESHGAAGRITVTGVVDEALSRVLAPGMTDREFPNSASFYAYCTQALRRRVLELCRSMAAAKRGPDAVHLRTEDVQVMANPNGLNLEERIGLLEALETLHAEDPRKATIVHLYYTHGMSDSQIGLHLGMSRSLVEKERRLARFRLKTLLTAPAKPT